MRLVIENTDPIFGGGEDHPEVRLTKAEVATLRKAAEILGGWADLMVAEVGTDAWYDGDADTLDVSITRWGLAGLISAQVR